MSAIRLGASHDQDDPIRRWLERLEQAPALRDLAPLPVEAGLPVDLPAFFRCAQGHSVVAFVAPECPVCSVTQRTGYSEKWCEACRETTAHVGGQHINATCVPCLSRRQQGKPR